MTKKTLYLLMCLLLVPYVLAGNEYFERGAVKESFAKATISVFPYESRSPIKDHAQTVTICNNEKTNQWLFTDANFPTDLRRNAEWTKTITVQRNTSVWQTVNCKEVSTDSNGTRITYTQCDKENTVDSQLITEVVGLPVAKAIGAETLTKHYLTTTGTFLPSGQCQDYNVRYQPHETEGKWNARFWASAKNDWSCINDEPSTCSFDYTLDPTFNTSCLNKRNISLSKLGATETIQLYFKGSNVFSVNTTNNRSNITFSDASETTLLNFLIDYINSSGNEQQEMQVFVNVSGDTSIFMYYDCNLESPQEKTTTGNANPAMRTYYNFDDGMQGWVEDGGGGASCGLTNMSSINVTQGGRRGLQVLSATFGASADEACRPTTNVGINDRPAQDFVRMEWLQQTPTASVLTGMATTNTTSESILDSDIYAMLENTVTRWQQRENAASADMATVATLESRYNAIRFEVRMNTSDINGIIYPFTNRSAGTNRTLGLGDGTGTKEIYVFGANTAKSFFDDIKIWIQDDGTNISIGVEESSSPATDLDANLSILNTTGNDTSLELQLQTYSLNISFNTSEINLPTCTLTYENHSNTLGTVSSNVENATGSNLNITSYNATRPSAIITNNATAFDITWNCTWTGNDAANATLMNLTQTVNLAFAETDFNFTNFVQETSNQSYSLNLSTFETILYSNLTFFYDNGSREINATTNTSIKDPNGFNDTLYNVSEFRTNLVTTNNTNISIVFTMLIFYENTTTKTINTSVENQTHEFVYIPDGVSAPDTVETKVFQITANMTKLFSVAAVTAQIENNFTNVTAIEILNNDTLSQWQASPTAAFNGVGAPENITFNYTVFWQVNDTSSEKIRTDNGSHVVYTMIVKECAGTEARTINISYKDITDSSPVNVTGTHFYTLFANPATNSNRTVLLNQSGEFHEACIVPNIDNVRFNNDLTSNLNASGFVDTSFVQSNANRTNLVENITVFLQPTGVGEVLQNITIEVVDTEENALVDHVVEVKRFVPSSSSFVTIGSDFTDINGEMRIELDTASDNEYKFFVFNPSGTKLLETTSFKILQTSYRLIVTLQSFDVISNLLAFQNFNHNLTWNNETSIFEFDFSDDQDVASQLCLKVTRMSPNETAIKFDFCTTNNSGTIIGNMSAFSNSSFEAIAYGFTNNPKPQTIATLSILQNTDLPWKFEGLFITFMIMVLTVGAGMAAGAVPTIILTLIALIVTAMMKLYLITFGILAGLIFVGALIAIKSRL